MVCILAVEDAAYLNPGIIIINPISNSENPYSDSVPLATNQLLAPLWPWTIGQGPDRFQDSPAV